MPQKSQPTERELTIDAKNAVLAAIEASAFYGVPVENKALRDEIRRQHHRVAKFLGMKPNDIHSPD